MRRREKVVSVYKELAVTLKASQRLSHGRIYEIPSQRCLVSRVRHEAVCEYSSSRYQINVLASILAVVCASYDENHGGTTYHETSKPVEIPIYKKYAIPIPHPVPVPVPQEIKVPIPQPFQVPVAVPHPVPVEVVKHIEIPVEKPEPYVVEKKIPYVVEKPYPVTVEKHFPVPIPKPYPVHVPVYKHVFHHQSSGHGWKH
ncbi:hypothetical protein HN011_012096 [Eciton burchellii]|nr:hypothetical protein HN011_012096 [Eciton burchellii]